MERIIEMVMAFVHQWGSDRLSAGTSIAKDVGWSRTMVKFDL